MITIGTHPDIPEAELQAYLEHANNTYPHRNGAVLGMPQVQNEVGEL